MRAPRARREMPGTPHTAMDKGPRRRTEARRMEPSETRQAEMRGANEKGHTLQSASRSRRQAMPDAWRCINRTSDGQRAEALPRRCKCRMAEMECRTASSEGNHATGMRLSKCQKAGEIRTRDKQRDRMRARVMGFGASLTHDSDSLNRTKAIATRRAIPALLSVSRKQLAALGR